MGKKSKGVGSWGRPKILEHFFWNSHHLRLFKVLEEKPVFETLIHFQRLTILYFIKRFGSLLKVLYCWIPLKYIFYLGKMSRGEDGVCTSFGLFITWYFLKVFEDRTVFKTLIHFQRPFIWYFTLFCCILQNVLIDS